MALDTPCIAFLFGCKAAGVDFTNLLTLGRQEFFPSRNPLRDMLEAHGIGRDVDELIKSSAGRADKVFTLLGALGIESVDASAYEGADVVHDLNEPVDGSWKSKYSVVYDGGTLEHVFNFPVAIRNCMEMLAVGGYFISTTEANNYMGHGFYQLCPELMYRVFSEENGFSVVSVLLCANRRRRAWYRAVDPRSLGRRAELRGGPPIYMMTLARKDRECALFRTWPQQSDYSQLWLDGRQGVGAGGGVRPRMSLVKHAVPEWLKDILRPLVYSKSRLYLRTREFVPIAEKKVIVGEW